MDAEETMMNIWKIIVEETDLELIRNQVTKLLIDYFNESLQNNISKLGRYYQED